MMKEVADIAQAISEATDDRGTGGKVVTAQEFKRIDLACEEAMEKIVETRERYRTQYLADKNRKGARK